MVDQTIFFVENDPFPAWPLNALRAFAALTYAAKRGEFSKLGMATVPYFRHGKMTRQRLVWLIAQRLSRYTNVQLATILHPATDWLQNASTKLSKDHLLIFDRILSKLVGVLREYPNESRSVYSRFQGTRLGYGAINSLLGKITGAFF